MEASKRQVTLVQVAPTPTAVIVEATTWEAFPARWPEMLSEVWSYLRQAGLETDRNVMLYRDDLPNVEVGVEVRRPFAPEGRVVPSSLPAGLAAKTIETGPPSPAGLAQAHAAVRAWCDANHHELEGTRWEVYGHWREEQDPAEYETEVYWLLRENSRGRA
jgi:effector-binding domain-containing protein